MRYNQYKYKFYLNANHSIYINGVLGQKHPHTWEIMLDTIKVMEGFVQFNDVEKDIDDFLEQYQDQYMNEIEPFTTLNPTLENICIYFKDCIQKSLMEKGWLLLSIEISETPTRSFIINLYDEEENRIAQDASASTNHGKSMEELAEEVIRQLKD